VPARAKITVVFDDGISRAVDRKLDRIVAEAYDVCDDLAGQAASYARGIAPVETGRYRGSIMSSRHAKGKRVGVDVKSLAPHAALVERGRRAGKPPPVSVVMAAWGLPRRQAFMVARRIGQKGTKGRKVMAKTKKAMTAETLAAHIRFGRWLSDLDAP
jgi:hypothetical protein